MSARSVAWQRQLWVYHHGQGERPARGEGRGERSWMSVDETVKVRHSKVWEIRRGRWHLRNENPQMMMMMMMNESFRHYFFHYGVKKWGRALLSWKWRHLSYPKRSLSSRITWWTENSREATLTSTPDSLWAKRASVHHDSSQSGDPKESQPITVLKSCGLQWN